ncbi:MAG: hypothetical protein ACPG6V_13655 [Flavobacteriales bacterium]
MKNYKQIQSYIDDINLHPNKRISTNSSQEEITWIPVFNVHYRDDYFKIFGISAKGKWVLKTSRDIENQIFEINVESDSFYLITLLEKDRKSIELAIEKGLKEYNLDDSMFQSFPFKDLMKYTLKHGSFHWVQKASFWLNVEDFDKDFVLIVKEIVENKKFTQKVRHQLFRLMKRYEKSLL